MFVHQSHGAAKVAGRQRLLGKVDIGHVFVEACGGFLLLGAFPFPGISIATDLLIVGLQVGLARDIGALWGHQLDYPQAKGLLAGFGVAIPQVNRGEHAGPKPLLQPAA